MTTPSTSETLPPENSDSQDKMPSSEIQMTFVQHFEELRRRLFICIGALVLTTSAAFFYTTPIIKALQTVAPYKTQFIQLYAGEVFLVSFKLSVIAGIGLALPILLYHLFQFVSPGLQSNERKYVLPLLLTGLFLFVIGVLVGYYGMMPFMFDFLFNYGHEIARVQPSIAAYLNFCIAFLFACGLVFQLPMLLLFMSFLRIISAQKLIKYWKWALMGSFILGAIITPSADPFSQIVMSIALAVLYGISILLIRFFGR